MNEIDLISGIAVPLVVWLLMLVVGLELEVADFRRVLLRPKAVGIATLGQLLLLPLVAAILIWTLEPQPYVVAGMVLLAACPGGAISNFYAYLAGANVALSVTLTAVSSFIAFGTMPMLTSLGFSLFFDPAGSVEVPVARMATQLAIVLLLPIVVGMALRSLLRPVVERHARGLRRLSLVALTVLVAAILLDQRQNLMSETAQVIVSAILFSLIAMAAGWGVGKLAGLADEDRFVLLVEFGARNLGIAAVVGIMVLERSEFVLFATLFFLAQVPIMLLAARVFKGRRNQAILVRPKREIRPEI